jgi:hypothetical protein
MSRTKFLSRREEGKMAGRGEVGIKIRNVGQGRGEESIKTRIKGSHNTVVEKVTQY